MTQTKALELINVSKTYKGGFKAVDNISFSVSPGDFFALLGPNGAGKSTTLGMISSLVNLSEGQIKIFGYDIEKDYQKARRYLGVMPQEVNLNIFETPWQILHNQAGFFGIPRHEATEQMTMLLSEMALWDKRHTQVRFLSGGMKRRLMVARALVHKPRLLILDEPTAGVDVELRQSLWVLMEKLNREGLTIILTTHYLEEAESMCNRIALINQGRVHKSSDMKSLLRSLDKEIYVCDLKHPLDTSQPLSLSVGDISICDDVTIEIEVDKNVSLNAIFAELTSQNIEVLGVKTKTAKLEKLFLDMAQQNHNTQEVLS